MSWMSGKKKVDGSVCRINYIVAWNTRRMILRVDWVFQPIFPYQTLDFFFRGLDKFIRSLELIHRKFFSHLFNFFFIYTRVHEKIFRVAS